MDPHTLNAYRTLVRKVLLGHTEVPFANRDVQAVPIFDPEADRYLLMLMGWEKDGRRVHGCLVHVDILNGKLWVQRDGTERGVANDFVEAGVPKSQIVLGFRSPSFRKHTEFAVG